MKTIRFQDPATRDMVFRHIEMLNELAPKGTEENEIISRIMKFMMHGWLELEADHRALILKMMQETHDHLVTASSAVNEKSKNSNSEGEHRG